jgi:5-(aminomethyl)-3-furanmethanol phosphate kinase
MTTGSHFARSITVLKIGGSVVESGNAAAVMRALAARRPRNLLLVPGGGAFADAVRAAQASHQLSDQAAHHMALLAMQMSAVMLADMAPGFALAEERMQFETAWRADLTPIWLPAPMALAAQSVAASWDVTSDSLAAWLAQQVAASQLLLMKSCELPSTPCDAQELSRRGVVDAAFPAFVQQCCFSWRVVSGVEALLAALP